VWESGGGRRCWQIGAAAGEAQAEGEFSGMSPSTALMVPQSFSESCMAHPRKASKDLTRVGCHISFYATKNCETCGAMYMINHYLVGDLSPK
jgi:hypothetical protein